MQRATRKSLACLAMALVLTLAGCGQELNSTYGVRRPAGSVNGTEVLGQLFAEAGHDVSSWGWLSPRLAKKADCIVWFANDDRPPSDDVCAWLDDWLYAAPGRTLIYVGRDYDAATAYWKQVRQGTQGEEHKRLSRRLADAQNERLAHTAGLKPTVDCPWFEIDRTQPRRDVRNLQGRTRWLDGIDPTKVEIELGARIIPPSDARSLLRDGKDRLVSRVQYDDSQMILVANGSFLLNLPLVNHQHRKLAAKLVDEIGATPQQVVFLDVPSGNPGILDADPQQTHLGVLDWLKHPTLGMVVLHLAALATLVIYCRAPIFGLPKTAAAAASADFGQHVAALGSLLERAGDEEYARGRIAAYEALVRREPEVETKGAPAN
jgi:hypothetical protein